MTKKDTKTLAVLAVLNGLGLALGILVYGYTQPETTSSGRR